MSTISDVAKLAGVSTATVSHVLNNTRVVLPETRQRVLDAIERLNYRPSAIARGLITNSTNTLGLVLSETTSPFHAFLMRGLEERFAPAGASSNNGSNYSLIVYNTDDHAEREAYSLALLLDRRVDGVVITPTGADQPLYKEFIKQDIPMIFVDRRPPAPFGAVVSIDHIEAGYRATEYLISLGHTRIGICARLPHTLSPTAGRIQGYRKAMAAHNLPVDEDLVQIAALNAEDMRAAAERFIHMPDRPTALIATNHIITLELLQALQAHNLTWAEDISLVCFDNSRWTSIVRPALTVVCQPINAICEAVSDLMLMALAQKRQRKQATEPSAPHTTEVILPAELIIRDSCRPLH